MKDDDGGEIKYQEKVIRPNFSPSSIRDQLRQEFGPRQPAKEPPPAKPEEPPPPPAEETERDDPLPRPHDAYKAHARPQRRRRLASLAIVRRNYLPHYMAYAELSQVFFEEPPEPGQGPVLVLLYSGRFPVKVDIEGLLLVPLSHGIGMHEMPWVLEHPSPHRFADAGDAVTVITRITIRVLE